MENRHGSKRKASSSSTAFAKPKAIMAGRKFWSEGCTAQSYGVVMPQTLFLANQKKPVARKQLYNAL